MNLYNILNNRYCLLYLNTDNLSIIPEFLPVILINILYCMLIYFQHFNSTAHVTIKKHLPLKKKSCRASTVDRIAVLAQGNVYVFPKVSVIYKS